LFLQQVLLAAVFSAAAPAYAGLQYQTVGEDFYRVESSAKVSHVTYSGTERLSIRREDGSLRFEARARYVRSAPEGKSNAEALFVQVLDPGGAFEDRVDDDPDFLTILNQPFAVQLDAATLRDVRELRGRVPFAATSPLDTATLLHGFLRPAAGGPIQGRPTVAVRFEADGPMNGTLPGHPDAIVSGTMRMDGTAYYALDDAILLALNVRLAIHARLNEHRQSLPVPVRITYHRWIRAI
jgi:hypothetical protein